MTGRLRGFDEADRADRNGSFRQAAIEDNSIEFRSAAVAINPGLSMIETPIGNRRIEAIGQRIIGYRSNFEYIYEDDPQNMLWWVELFLARLRASFPNVVLTNHIGGEGQTEKAN
ncbi:Fc.00g059860.m01.CDS01 [Cosmosporella sp. VM-42]